MGSDFNPYNYTNPEVDDASEAVTENIAVSQTYNGEGLTFVNSSDFDPMYSLTDAGVVAAYLQKNAHLYGIDLDSNRVPTNVLAKRKRIGIYSAIWIVLLLLSQFFHIGTGCLFVFLIAGVILFFQYKKKFSLTDYIVAEIQKNPKENMLAVAQNVNNTLVDDDHESRRFGHIVRIVALAAILIVFIKPRMLYEYDSLNNGYYVSKYIAGVTGSTSIVIPDTYSGKPVIGIRGDVFNNLILLKSVSLPESVIDIRGHAFENDTNLVKINIPDNLTRIGGGAFAGCSSLKEISIPDTVTEIEGEAFKGCKGLKTVVLSENLTEIRGNTFEGCTSLTSINIPDNVTRIAAHSFYGDSSLKTVTISSNSKLNEIGSSAFRECMSLREITLPKGVSINDRAFKDSPTKIMYME